MFFSLYKIAIKSYVILVVSTASVFESFNVTIVDIEAKTVQAFKIRSFLTLFLTRRDLAVEIGFGALNIFRIGI